MMDSTRPVPTYVGADGVLHADSVFSVTDNKVRALVRAPAPNVIPIIFSPGIMGSNLMAKREVKSGKKTLVSANSPIWRVDSGMTFGFEWKGRSAAERQLLIDKDNLIADPRGRVDDLEQMEAASRAQIKEIEPDNPALAKQLSRGLDVFAAGRADRRGRGWGTVSWAFYGKFLGWLEYSLSDLGMSDGKPNKQLAALLSFVNTIPKGAVKKPTGLSKEMIQKLLKFHFPVHACGYNWAASNLKSGELLAEYIKQTIQRYDGKNGQRCSQVIVITHSMGGLVVRAAAMASGAKDQILGVVHGVMPTHGAAAMYKRAVAGFSGETYSWNPLKLLTGRIAGKALGASSVETTPILAFNPGPFELAPNHRYNGGKPWLFIKDKQGRTLKALPENGDPYKDIYRQMGVWWQTINPERLNPAGLPGSQREKIDKYLGTLDRAEFYHRKLADNGFHPNTYGHYSVDAEHPAWGDLTYEVIASEVYTPSTYSVGLGAPVLPIPTRINDPKKQLNSAPETWKIERHDGEDEFFLRDRSGAGIRAKILKKGNPGDSTVPAMASAAGLDAHCKIVCRHEKGYEHDANYGDERAKSSVIDAVVRMVESVPVKI